MRAYIAEGPHKASFQEVDTPVLKPDEILVKIKYAGICGTDLAIYSGECSFVKSGQIIYPVRFGHEWSGIVAKVGINVKDFSIGDNVVGDNFIACGECESCLAGDINGCTAKRNVGTIDCWDGCFAEYMVVPQRHLYHLSENVPMIEAALMEPLSVAYGGIKKCNITPKSTVTVIGTGPIGMSAVALAKYKGAGQIIMVGRNSFKLDIARKVGATHCVNISKVEAKEAVMDITGGKGTDFIIEASGSPDAVDQAINLASQKCFIALIGFYEQNINNVNIDMFVSKEISMTGIMGEYGNLAAVNKIMSEYDLGLSPIITEQITFDECPIAFANESLTHNTRIKTIMKMPD